MLALNCARGSRRTKKDTTIDPTADTKVETDETIGLQVTPSSTYRTSSGVVTGTILAVILSGTFAFISYWKSDAVALRVSRAVPADPTEAALLRHLSSEPLHVDEIRRAADIPIAAVSSTLTLMELKGLVRHVGGMQYVRGRA